MFLVIFLLARVSPATEEAPKSLQGVELLFPIDDGAVPKDKKKKDAKAEKTAKRQAALLKKLKAIEKGGDVNSADKKGQTALMQAAAANNRLAVCWLVAKGANAALKNKKGKTARDLSTSIAIRELLRLAANEKKPLTKEEKLRYHVDDKPTKEELQQSLCFALPYVEDVVNLIKMGAKPTAWDVDEAPILEPMKKEKASLDEKAAPESIAWLTRKGVDFTERGKDGKWTGGQYLSPPTLRLLLALGVKPDLQKDDPLVCLQAALEGNDIPGIRAALAKDPKLATVWAAGVERRYLLRNVHTGAAMKAFIECGLQKAPIGILYSRDNGSNSTEALDALLNAGFPLIRENEKDKSREMRFLLEYMSKYHCKGLFSRLISAGVDPNGDYRVTPDWDPDSPLSLAVQEHNSQALHELLAAGTKLPEKQNPLSFLKLFNVPEMVYYYARAHSRAPYIEFPTRGIAQLSSWRTECEYSLGIYDIIDTLVKAGCPVPDSFPIQLMNSFMPPNQFKQCPDLPPAMVDLFASPEKILRFALKLCGNKAPKDALVNTQLFVHIHAPFGGETDPREEIIDFSPEQLACIAGILLDAGADPTATDKCSRTALMLAGSTDATLAKRIMDAGVNPSAKDYFGRTALHTVRNVKTAQALLDAGASVQEAEEKVRILDSVIRQDDNADVPELCRFWKGHGAKFDADFVEHLLADWGRERELFQFPDRYPVDTYLKILEFIADGTDIVSYQSPKTKQSFLHSTAKLGNVERVQALLQAGANINARDKDGKTPLMYVRPDFWYDEMQKFLIKHGADINAQDNDGNTYLHNPEIDEETCRLLLDSDARTDIKNKDGKTALQIAREKKNEKVVKLLEERGAKK